MHACAHTRVIARVAVRGRGLHLCRELVAQYSHETAAEVGCDRTEYE